MSKNSGVRPRSGAQTGSIEFGLTRPHAALGGPIGAVEDLSREVGFCRTKVRRAGLEFSPQSLPANSAMRPL
jgi:hypothetical protein